MEHQSMGSKTKYLSMNHLRVLAFCFIIVYHFMVELEQKGNYNFLERGWVYYTNGNFHIAIIGVSLFFMISGAGLMLSSTRKWDVKDFYKRRFTKLLIPFYIVEIFSLIASFVLKPEWLGYFPSVSKSKLLLNLLGMDGYFEQFFPTFSLHVGEWFLGALIMLYGIFPIFRFCMGKNRYVTIIVATIYYIIMVFSDGLFASPWTNVFIKAYDFLLGMFLILELPKLMDKTVFRLVAGIVSAIIIILGIVLKIQLPTPMTFNNLVYATMIFVCFFSLEKPQTKATFYDGVIDRICQISYEVFLVHHIVIYYIGDNLEGQLLGLRQIGALFITELFIMVAMAMLVKTIVTALNIKIKKPQGG